LGENGLKANRTWTTVGTIGFSGAAGGVIAELTEGDFWKGAATGLTIGTLNHGLHDVYQNILYKRLKDINGNRIIISAAQMYKFLSTKYGTLMSKYDPVTSSKGIYVGLTSPGTGYSGHVTIIKPGFNSSTFSANMRITSFWKIN